MKICIIKLGAKGDVVRTMSILPKLKEKFPDSEITWITKENTKEIFLRNPYVENVLNPNEKPSENFDLLYCLDMDREASDLALSIKAKDKKGFYLEGGYPMAFNSGAGYYVDTFFDDELKKANKKTAQEMYFMACEVDYNKELCQIFLDEKEKEYGINFAKEKGIYGKKIIGIHIGSSPRWPSRNWHKGKLMDFVGKIKDKGYEIIFFGGPLEGDKLPQILKSFQDEGLKVYPNNPDNTDREFFSLVNVCDIMITPDSFSMHVSLALKKPTIGLFFCTPPHEIESYGILKKIISPILYDFFPERMDADSEELTKSIPVGEVLNAVLEIEDKNDKIKSLEDLSAIIKNLKKQNKKIIWTSGCFDILHSGHTKYLKKAKEYGDCLIVGLNTDSSVRLLKGENRPINLESSRAEVLSSLSSVDYIVLFSETEPIRHLMELKPDVYIKGGDYTLDSISQIQRNLIEENGGKIILIEMENGASTTNIVEKIKDIYNDANK